MVSLDVTCRTLSLGSRDAWSGWRAKSWAETTIEMIVIPKGSSKLSLLAGIYPRTDAVGLTNEAVFVGDQIKDSVNTYYDVQTTRDTYWGNLFVYRECDLNNAVMYQSDFAATTWTLTRGSDARYRTKVYLDTNLRVAQITKDNDSTQATWAAIMNEPPYPVSLEFRGTSNMNGLFVIDQPTVTPIMDALTQIPYGYEEAVPIHIMAVDSTSCSGSALAWKMEAELRYCCETFPFGSVRTLQRRGKSDRELGGMMLYDTEYVMKYRRAKTV